MASASRNLVVLRIAAFLLVGAGLCAAIYYAPAFFMEKDRGPATPQLKVSGTSVAFVLMENRWRGAFRKDKGIDVAYDSVGSTAGVENLIEKKSAVVFTHAPLTKEQREQAEAKGGEVVQVPVVLCAVVPIYNFLATEEQPQTYAEPPLKFSPDVLADIFLGKIDRWDHEELARLNEGRKLPKKKITVVHREDSSGTTLIFSDYLSKASPHWHAAFPRGAASKLDWPVGVGRARSQGMAAEVKQTDGAIGYVDFVHAFDGEIARGAVENADKDKEFVVADDKSMTAAAQTALEKDVPDDLGLDLTYRTGKGAYPISGVVYAICYRKQPAADGQRVKDFLHWITHEGQPYAPRMSYARLPDKLVKPVEDKIESIQVGG